MKSPGRTGPHPTPPTASPDEREARRRSGTVHGGLALAGLLLAAPAARGQYLVEFTAEVGPFSVDAGNGHWPAVISIPQFDSASLGKLLRVDLWFTVEMTTSLGIENTTLGTGATVTYSLPLLATFSYPVGGTSTIDLGVSRTVALGPYDGVADFDGASGISYSGGTALTATATVHVTVPVELQSAYEGIGTLAIEVAPGLGVESMEAGAGKSLFYAGESVVVARVFGEYTLDLVPEGSGWVSAGGLLACGALWRCRLPARHGRS